MWILGERLERKAICFLLVVKLRHVSVLKVAWNDRMQREIKRKKVRNINWRVARAGGKKIKRPRSIISYVKYRLLATIDTTAPLYVFTPLLSPFVTSNNIFALSSKTNSTRINILIFPYNEKLQRERRNKLIAVRLILKKMSTLSMFLF